MTKPENLIDDKIKYFFPEDEESLDGQWETLAHYYYLETDQDLSFEDFKDQTLYLTFEEFLEHMRNNVYEENYWEYDGIPFMREIHSETLDSYVDYKRGYEEKLFVYEPNYKAIGIKAPKKADRRYLGVRYTEYHHGEIYNFEVSEYQQEVKRITVKTWVSI